MSDTLSLAMRLRGLDDTELADAIRRREVKPGPIKDFFDLAEALLDRASIQQQLSRLDRGILCVIAAIAELGHRNRGRAVTAADVATELSRHGDGVDEAEVDARASAAVELLLVESEMGRYAAFDSVSEQLRSWPAFGLPGLDELASGPPPAALEPVSETEGRFIDRVASERAFASTTEITELLVELEREPARELARGGIALPDTKRLANAMAVDLESVAKLLLIAEHADLVARESGQWLITDAGGAWLLEPGAGKWRALAAGWYERLPRDVRRLLADRSHALWGEGLRGFIEWLYPAGGEWVEQRIVAYTADAEALGITANQAPSGPGTLLLTDGPDAAAPAMAALLPREVEQVYLQHDLSVVAPGPLVPSVDYRLRSLADVESRALASSYRVSSSTMNRAMAAGETADSVREFLSGISLTGIPQPLDYLIAEASARYGLLRAGEGGDGGARSYLRSDDTALLDAIAVDQSLSALALQRVDERRIVSRATLDTLFWMLSDARYPVAAEDSEGRIVSLRRRRHARAAASAGLDPVDDLIERLRLGSTEANADETEDAWMARQLDTAIRGKAALTVSVRMPDGSISDYQLEPTSVAGGRLRARDRRADIERTLPLSSITGLAPAADPE